MTIDQAMQLAVRHHQAGQLAQAEGLYRQILAQLPAHADCLHLLGVIAQQTGRNDVAVDLLGRAVAIRPNWPEAQSNLGVAMLDKGNVLTSKGQLDEAIAAYRRAVALIPDYLEAHVNLGNVLKEVGQLDEAIAACRRAIAIRPSSAEAHNNLGNALKEKGQLAQAVAAYRQAVAFRANYPEAHNNLGLALADAGQAHEAVAAFGQAIALRPDYLEAHGNLSLALLVQGDFRRGWDEYEWRWKCKDFPSPPRNFVQPPWDGRPLVGATLLLHAEQGLGDAIQFIRYVSPAAQRVGKVVIECHPELHRLVANSFGQYQVVPRGEPMPAFDVHCPLLSLARLFGTTLETIPRQVPYLRADVETVGKWRERLAGASGPLKVGLTWAGSKTHPNDRNRSVGLSTLAPLLRLPNISFHSLQKGPAAEQAGNLAAGFRLADWTGELTDLAETAALIENLDLVISVDTAVAHLAGALGKPVWLLLPFVPDWRWLLYREDSPWYPTMRLFRQNGPGEWGGVMERVANCLVVYGGALAHAFPSSRVTPPNLNPD